MHPAGVFAPIPTPFDDRGRIDPARLRRALDTWIASPLTGFVVLGSNGEAALLDEDETDRVVAEARAVVPRGRPFIVGTGRESTRATILATGRAAAAGADAVLVRTPGFFKSQMTTDVFVRHYTAVADESPVPVLLYNFTAVTGVNLRPDAVSRLAEHPNIVGAKESGSDMAQIAAMVDGTPPGFAVLAGSGSTFVDALTAGAAGGILALSLVVPDACVRLFELYRAGQIDEARALQVRMLPIAQLIGTKHGVPGLKAALNILGLDVGRPRLPLVPAPDEAVSAIRQALNTFEAYAA